MTASERIRAARLALDEFNRILEENGDEPTTPEELCRAGIALVLIEEIGGREPVDVGLPHGGGPLLVREAYFS